MCRTLTRKETLYLISLIVEGTEPEIVGTQPGLNTGVLGLGDIIISSDIEWKMW